MRAPLEQAIQDRLGQVAIMEHIAKRRQRLIRRQQHRTVFEVALVDHAIEYIRRVGGVREVAQLVDDQDVRMEKGLERTLQAPLRRRVGEPADQRVRAGEARLVAVLDRAVRDRDAAPAWRKLSSSARTRASTRSLGTSTTCTHREHLRR